MKNFKTFWKKTVGIPKSGLELLVWTHECKAKIPVEVCMLNIQHMNLVCKQFCKDYSLHFKVYILCSLKCVIINVLRCVFSNISHTLLFWQSFICLEKRQCKQQPVHVTCWFPNLFLSISLYIFISFVKTLSLWKFFMFSFLFMKTHDAILNTNKVIFNVIFRKWLFWNISAINFHMQACVEISARLGSKQGLCTSFEELEILHNSEKNIAENCLFSHINS